MNGAVNFLLAGVGGQGTILASDVLVNVGRAAGLSAKQAEVHGMSQRGGSVISHVRWGWHVYSPMAGAGEIDVLLAFEKAETLRSLWQLRTGALVVADTHVIEPVTVTSGGQLYPSDEQLTGALARLGAHVSLLDGSGIAERLGNVRAANTVLLGALSVALERHGLLDRSIPAAIWLEQIAAHVPPRYLAVNQAAFEAGARL
jgi:indolepyruvate ferredoxin oxidoreductase, beta subunit